VIILWFLLAIGGVFGLWLSDRHVVPIMMYHSVNYETQKNVNTVHPQNFARHLEFLKKNHYQVISLPELVQAIAAHKPLPRKSVVITFDDGYEDNYTHAFPLLKRFGFPATIFLIADEIGKAGYLTLEQIKEMEKAGVTIGAHTRTHAYLPELSVDRQLEEVTGSKKILEKKLGHPVEHFAYPNGGFSEQIKILVREAGFKAACATNRGYDRLNQDRYELKRIRFGDEDDSDIILFTKLSGFYTTFKKIKSPY